LVVPEYPAPEAVLAAVEQTETVTVPPPAEAEAEAEVEAVLGYPAKVEVLVAVARRGTEEVLLPVVVVVVVVVVLGYLAREEVAQQDQQKGMEEAVLQALLLVSPLLLVPAEAEAEASRPVFVMDPRPALSVVQRLQPLLSLCPLAHPRVLVPLLATASVLPDRPHAQEPTLHSVVKQTQCCLLH